MIFYVNDSPPPVNLPPVLLPVDPRCGLNSYEQMENTNDQIHSGSLLNISSVGIVPLRFGIIPQLLDRENEDGAKTAPP